MPKELNGAPLVPQTVKNLHAVQDTQVPPLGQEGALERGMAPTPGFLPGEFHGEGPGAVVRGISKN